MRSGTRVALAVSALSMMMVASYLVMRGHRTDLDAAISSTTLSPSTSRSQPGGIPTPSIQPLSRMIQGDGQRKALLAVNPLERGTAAEPQAGNISFLRKGSREDAAVRDALEMMRNGEYGKARDVLQIAMLMTSYRGSLYLRLGRPTVIGRRSEPTPSENWRYENQDGTTRQIVDFISRPADGQAGDLDPKHPRAGASAFWAYAYTHYGEGGLEHLRIAAGQFQDFLTIFPNGPEELVQAAQLDIGVINLDLMQSAPTLGYRIAVANEAAKAFKAFLARWPNNAMAPGASAALVDIQNFLANPR